MEIIKWIQDNYIALFQAVALILGSAEIIVRLTPTKKDDSALERIGGVFRKVMDFLKIPNLKSK